MNTKTILFFLLLLTGCTPAPVINQPVNPMAVAPVLVVEPPLPVQVKKNSEVKTATVLINFIGDVTFKKANELTSTVQKEMNKGIKNFVININSYGGKTDAGVSAYQYLKSLPITLSTQNIGSAQSSAALIYCSGSKRYALPHSFFMLHGSATTYQGGMSLVTMEALLKLNKMHLSTFSEIFSQCSDLTHAEREKYFSSNQAYYFTAAEAKAIGLVQNISAAPMTVPVLIYNITD